MIPDSAASAEGRPTPRLEAAETDIEPALRSTPHGPVWVATARYGDAYPHGSTRVALARGWDPSALAALARDAATALAPEAWAFLDVETTGLGLHANTVAFLVGIAWIAPQGLVVEQFLMRDPSEEPALLHAVDELLHRFAGVITFNGKTFDLPLLGVRAAMARRVPPHAGLVHCDLLHAARRAWSHRAESCRLVALERQFLGLRRQDDIDGALIPDLYLDALRTGRGDLLDPILAHNRLDLVSLVLLTAAAARWLERAEPGNPPQSRDALPALAADWLRAAEVHLNAGNTERATELLESCLHPEVPRVARQRGRGLLAQVRKRAGEWQAACDLWQAMATEEPHLVEPYEELAKALEHRRHDPAGALGWVEERLASPGLDAALQAAFLHRRARLQRKLHGGGGLGLGS